MDSVDVLIITAVADERDVVLGLEPDWAPHMDLSGYAYHLREDEGGFRWALARATDMGPELAANAATRLVTLLKPLCLAMVGVCAGWDTKVHLGDVIVAERLFRYDAGKLRTFRTHGAREEEIFHDIRTYNLNPVWRQLAEDFPATWAEDLRSPLSYKSQEHWLLVALNAYLQGEAVPPRIHPERSQCCPDWEDVVKRLQKQGLVELDGGLKLTDSGRRKPADIQDRFPDGPPPQSSHPKCHVAPMATGGRVVEDEELFPAIHRYARKTLGVDMESSAVAAIAEIEQVKHCLIVKGVQDYADREKDDRFRKYAIETSYRFLTTFLRRHMEPPKRQVPFIVPKHGTPSFKGRISELQSLENTLLATQSERVCTIAGLSGTGGIGKTALAVHFAAIHRDRFPDGVIGVRVDGKQVDAIAREFARNIGQTIDPEDERDAATIMQSLFAGRASLLIFDNADDASIRQLNPGGRCAIIITTRDRGLPILLDVPQQARIDVPVLPEADGVDLLRTLIGQRAIDEPEATRQIVNLVGGLPLALQIIGSVLQIESWRTLEKFATLLASERESLSRLNVRGDKDLDVRLSFTASLRLLKTEELNFFACLAVCAPDGFGIGSAAAAAGCNESTALDLLGYLHRLSLIDRHEGTRTLRFVLHPLLREFASEIASEHQISDSSAEHHARHFISVVRKLSHHDGNTVNDFIIDDIDEALIAAEWLLKYKSSDDTLHSGEKKFFKNFIPILQKGGYWKESANFLGQLQLLSRSPLRIRYLRNQQIKCLQKAGDFKSALSILLPIAQSIELDSDTNSHSQTIILTSLGGVYQRQNRLEEAEEVLEKAFALSERLEDVRGQSMTLNTLAGVYQRQSRFKEAEEVLYKAFSLSGKLNDLRGQAMILNTLGVVYQKQNRLREAEEVLYTSANTFEEIGDPQSQSMSLNSLGGVYQRQNKLERAASSLEKALDLSSGLNNPMNLMVISNSLGIVYQKQSRLEESSIVLRRALVFSEELNDLHSQAMILNTLGGVYQRQNHLKEAEEVLCKSLTLSEDLNDVQSQVMALNSLGGVYQRQDRLKEAEEVLHKALMLSEELNEVQSQAMILNTLGSVYQRQSRFKEAKEVLRKSLTLSEGLNDTRHLAMVLTSLGVVYQKQNYLEKAEEVFLRALTLSEELNDLRSQAMILTSLGVVYHRQVRLEETANSLQESLTIFEDLNDETGQCINLNKLGVIFQSLGLTDLSCSSFRACISIQDKLKNYNHLVRTRTTFGKILARQGNLNAAAEQLSLAFDLNLQSINTRGLVIVTPLLVSILRQLGAESEASDVINRALEFAPDQTIIKQLQLDNNTGPSALEAVPNITVTGQVTKLLTPHGRPRYGFITRNDGDGVVYFQEGLIPSGLFPQLSVGSLVTAEIFSTPRGPQASSIRLLMAETSIG